MKQLTFLFIATVFIFSINGCTKTCYDANGNPYDCTYGTYPNGTGGTPSTGGAPGTYTNPIRDYSVTHTGLLPFYVNDPSLASKQAYPQSATVIPDINQDGAVDLDGNVPDHSVVEIEGVVLDNGYYYSTSIATDAGILGIVTNLKNGTQLSADFSNKPYAYAGDPRNCPRNANGSYFISPGARAIYGYH